MKNKGKLYGIAFLLCLSLSVILSNVAGQTTYTCELKEGDVFIYTITVADQYYSFARGFNIGDKRKIEIGEIDESEERFYVDIYDWSWISKGESFSDICGGSCSLDNDQLIKHPTSSMLNPFWYSLFPVSDYLAEFAETSSDYSSSGNQLIYSNHFSTFDSNGVLYKNEYKDGDYTYWEMTRGVDSSSSIPGYDLPIVIGLTVIMGASIIYILRKKMLKQEDSKI